MKDLNINFPLDKFEKLIFDIGWESLDDWFKFWNNQKKILSINQYWNNKVNEDWIWGLALPLLSQAYIFHDDDLKRICEIPKKFDALKSDEIDSLTIFNNHKIPKLEDALNKFPDFFEFYFYKKFPEDLTLLNLYIDN